MNRRRRNRRSVDAFPNLLHLLTFFNNGTIVKIDVIFACEQKFLVEGIGHLILFSQSKVLTLLTVTFRFFYILGWMVIPT